MQKSGTVKLWMTLKRPFDETGCFPGRDAFIELLRRHGLMVKIRGGLISSELEPASAVRRKSV
jgi:hypothetical protein